MAGINEITQLMKMIARVQAKMEESDKKVEVMADVLQNLTNEAQADNTEQPPPLEDANDKGRAEKENKKERELEKGPP